MTTFHRRAGTRLAIASALCIASFLASSAVAANQSPILAHIFDREHIFHKVSDRFMKRLDELSDGSFDVQYHPGGDLGGWTDITEQVVHGQIQMTMTWNHSELDRRWDIAALGFVADDWDSAEAVYGTGSPLEDIYQDIVSNLGMELLGVIPIDFRGFVVREGAEVPTNFPEDAAGFKMRVPGWEMGIERYEALGFSPVPMPFEEVHTALQTGAIDGRAYSPPHEVPLFADVIDAYVFTREDFEHTFWLANARWLDSLTDEQRQWVRTAAKEAVDWAWTAARAESEQWLAEIEDSGVEIVRLPPEEREHYRDLVTSAERPFIEEIVGADLLQEIEEAAQAAR